MIYNNLSWHVSRCSACAEAHYRNLCALCDNPNGCYSDDKYHGPEGSLLCLTDNVGDIAWAKLDDAIRHFKV